MVVATLIEVACVGRQNVGGYAPSEIGARDYLITQFGTRSPNELREVEGKDLSYLNSPIVPVSNKKIEHFFPDSRVYVTYLQSAYYEYARVEALIIISKDSLACSCLSPVFQDPPMSFTHFFTRRTVTSNVEKERYAQAITDLLARIVDKGSVGSTYSSDGNYICELWHGDLHWRNVILTFQGDIVLNVDVVKPKRMQN
jgi:hypothetical protein